MRVIAPDGDDWPPVELRALIAERVQQYLREDGRLSLPAGDGPIAELEARYTAAIGVPYALATNTGTSALYSAFVAVGLQPDDEVLASAYSFHASVTPLLHLQVKPVLCDVNPTTGEIEIEDARSRLTNRTKAIVVTHLYGYPTDMRPIMAFAQENGLAVVEDCSHAHGASVDSRPVGSFGDAAVFSMQENKLWPAGEGGVLVTSRQDVYERAVLLGHFGARAGLVSDERLRALADTGFGMKLRMHPLAAIAANAGAEIGSRYTPHRRAHARKISEDVPQGLAFRYDPEAVYYRFRLLFQAGKAPISLTELFEECKLRGLRVRRASLPSLHHLPLFQGGAITFGPEAQGRWPIYNADSFPGANILSANLLSIPTFWNEEHTELRDHLLAGLQAIFATASATARAAHT